MTFNPPQVSLLFDSDQSPLFGGSSGFALSAVSLGQIRLDAPNRGLFAIASACPNVEGPLDDLTTSLAF